MNEKYSVKMAELMKESEIDIKINFLRLEEELPHNQNLIGKWMTCLLYTSDAADE